MKSAQGTLQTTVFRFTVLLLICNCLVEGADIEVYCTPYMDGQLSFATASVHSKKVIQSICSENTLTSLTFVFKNRSNRDILAHESTSYDGTPSSCNTAWSGNARCVSAASRLDIYTFEVRFFANKTEPPGTYLTVETDCIPRIFSGPPFSINYDSCRPIPITTGPVKVPNADIKVQCKDYRDGNMSVATVTVKGYRVNGFPCTPQSFTSLLFEFRDKATDKTVETKSAKYDPEKGVCQRNWEDDTRCANVLTSTKVFFYEIRFRASYYQHSKQYLTVTTNCKSRRGPANHFSEDHSSCDPIPVAQGPTTSPRVQAKTTVKLDDEGDLDNGTESSTFADQDDTNSTSTATGASSATTLGLGVGVGVFLIVLIVAVVIVSRRKRRAAGQANAPPATPQTPGTGATPGTATPAAGGPGGPGPFKPPEPQSDVGSESAEGSEASDASESAAESSEASEGP